jgi:hypothetical protein
MKLKLVELFQHYNKIYRIWADKTVNYKDLLKIMRVDLKVKFMI